LPKKTADELIAELPDDQRKRIEAEREALREAGITAESLKGLSSREIARLADGVLKDAGLGLAPPLEQDPAVVEQNERIVAALREVGLEVTHINDLVQSSAPYPQAIPILLRFLPEDLDRGIKECIVRALTVKEARGVAAKPLIREFERLPLEPEYEGLKWAIGNALTVVADRTNLMRLRG
jgi:hypothetical protein